MEASNERNAQGFISGGTVAGPGMIIQWQDGPMVAAVQTGTLVDDVLWAAQQRLEAYDETGLKCRENSIAITKIEEARLWLAKRHADRVKRGVAHTYSA